MSEVFLSYAKEDRPRARILAEALERQGWSVWWDREIPVGGVFDEVIERELTAARAVIVLWSERSVHSRWVKAEAEAAVERHKLFPVLIDRVPIPLAFRQFQAADLVEWDGGRESAEFPGLVSELGQRLGQRPGAVPTAEAHRDEPRRDLPARRPARWLVSGLIVVLLVVASIWVWRQLRPSESRPVPVPRESQPLKAPPEDEAVLVALQIHPGPVPGGDAMTGWIELSRPTILERVVRLVVNDEAYRREHGLAEGEFVIQVPPVVAVPPGHQKVEFPIQTSEVRAPALVAVEAHLDKHVEAVPVEVVPRSVEPRPELPPRPREPIELELFFVTDEGPRNHQELLGGTHLEMAVRLPEPAPETLRIELRVLPGTDLLFFPEFVEIPGGAREVPFVVEARPVRRPTDYVIEARLGDHARAEVRLSLLPDESFLGTLPEPPPRPREPIGLELFFVTDEGPRTHHELVGTNRVTNFDMVVLLAEPTDEKLRIELRVLPGTDLLFFPEFVEIPGGAREVPFVVEARPVGRPTDLVIEARLGDARAQAHLNLLPRR